MTETATQPGNRTFQPDADVHVTIEDQGKINLFARYNAKNYDIKSELAAKQNQLQNLEDACEELILLDNDASIPFQCGESFVFMNLNDTNKAIESAKEKIMSDIRELKETGNELKTKMNDLKTYLYSKFGNRISLEEDEE